MEKQFKVIAFTHKQADISEIGRFHIDGSELQSRLSALKSALNLTEVMFLSTCNRCEFLICCDRALTPELLNSFFATLYSDWDEELINWAVQHAAVWQGADAVGHLFRVTSSLDSLVIGEREIITQVRNAYEQAKEDRLSGDFLRLAVGKAIETAKRVYTETEISRKPVSVVNLAYHQLRSLNVKPESARVLVIGSGRTNRAFTLKLKKHGFRHFTIFNRTLENARALAQDLQGQAKPLSELADENASFDVLISCTGSTSHMVDAAMYKKLIGTDTSPKIAIDLAVPNDIDRSILEHHNVELIAMEELKAIAARNLQTREQELDHCEAIIEEHLEDFKVAHRIRQVELAMREVPQKVKEIKKTAVSEVFAREIDAMDDQAKAVLDKVMNYMEKKYISEPMKIARKIMLDPNQR